MKKKEKRKLDGISPRSTFGLSACDTSVHERTTSLFGDKAELIGDYSFDCSFLDDEKDCEER